MGTTDSKHIVLGAIACFLLFCVFPGRSAAQWQLPPLLPPEEYGNILISRSPEQPATFSHWSTAGSSPAGSATSSSSSTWW